MFEPKEREKREIVVGVRMTTRERDALRRLARRNGVSLSDYLRTCIVVCLRKGDHP